MSDVARHNQEIQRNLRHWEQKPVLRRIYRGFHETIAAELPGGVPGAVAELGSGVPDITEAIPGCIRTDLFPAPWIDQVENAYALSFADRSLAAVVLFDVFHHLRYPGAALDELARVLAPGGRVIVFEPCVSLLGRLVYGALHDEPLALGEPIQWSPPADWSPRRVDYYAAQGNASRVFLNRELDLAESGWRTLRVRRLSAVSYVLSGGYSKPQLYPNRAYPLMRGLDRLCDRIPALFATRLLAVLERA